MKALLSLLLVTWAPGEAIFRLPFAQPERRAALPAEERLFWSLVIGIAVSLSIVLALAAAHRYSFSRLLVADAVITAAAIAAGWRSPGRPVRARPGLAALVPIAIAVFAALRFGPPSEYVIGGKDPGVYVNAGVQIAQRGTLAYHDPVVAAVPAEARALFVPQDMNRTWFIAPRFMGFFVLDPDRGTVVSQFPHLFPASIAIGYGVDGLTGARWTVTAWGVVGLLAVYFLGARLFGRTAAAAAAVLLALHVIEVWFARYPNAEVAMQALLFAALLANARAHVDRDPFFAPVAGVLLGLLLFLRYDVVLGIAGLAAGLVLNAVAHRAWPRKSFLAAFGIVAALAGMYLFGPMRPYMYLPIVFLTHFPIWEYVAIAAALALAVTTLTVASRSARLCGFVERWVPTIVIAVMWLLAIYALVLRQPGGKLAAHDANALRTFTYWYLTLPALLAALIGFALVVRRSFWRDPALIVTIAVFACVLFYKIRIVPEHFWMTRRFLAVILPGTLLFACAAALSGARERIGPSLGRIVIGAVFVVLLAVHYARASRPVIDHVEYAGLIPRLQTLADTIRDGDLAIVEARDANSDVHVLGLPLAYVYGRQVLVLNSARPDKAQLAQFTAWAHTRYRRVLFIGGGGTDLLSHRYGVRPIASERFQVPEYASLVDAYPTYVRRKEFEYGVYEFTDPSPTEGLWFDLDVGTRDDLHVLRFNAKEESEGRTFRWTGRRSFISVTVIHPDSRELTVWMSNGGRPASVPPADVTVSLSGEVLGTVRVGNGFAAYSFPISPALARRAAAFGDPVELALASTVWNPHDALRTVDDRDLGVMVDRVAVR